MPLRIGGVLGRQALGDGQGVPQQLQGERQIAQRDIGSSCNDSSAHGGLVAQSPRSAWDQEWLQQQAGGLYQAPDLEILRRCPEQPGGTVALPSLQQIVASINVVLEGT